MSLRFLFFPATCAACGEVLVEGERHICLSCLSDLPFSHFWNWRDNPAQLMLEEASLPIERTASLFIYKDESNWKKVLHKFKYGGNLKLGRELSQLLASRLLQSGWGEQIDLIVPVPLHWLKRWKRGYNQSEVIADVISKKLRLPVANSFLERAKYGSSQTRKDREERQKRVKSAFALTKKGRERVKGKRILLVDDVLTTGATVQGCFNALLKGEPHSISVVTLAFVE